MPHVLPDTTICYCASIQTNKTKKGRGCFVLFFVIICVKCFDWCLQCSSESPPHCSDSSFYQLFSCQWPSWLIQTVGRTLSCPTFSGGESPRCAPSAPVQGVFLPSFCFLLAFLSIVFWGFFCSDGFSLVPIHDRIIYFFSGPVKTNFWSSCFSKSCSFPEEKKSNFNMKRQNQPFWDKPSVFLWPPRRRLDKQCHTCEKST